MMLKPINDEQLKIILTEMCSRVSIKYEEVDFSQDGWFMDHCWTDEEQDNFRKWLAEKLLEWKCVRKGKYRGEPHGYYEAGKFVFNYGWRTKEEDAWIIPETQNIRELQYLLEKSKAQQIGQEPTEEQKEYDKKLETKINSLISKEPFAISLCEACYCMTHTVEGKCGKCGAEKEE